MDIQFSAEIKDFKVVYSVLKSIIFKEFVVFRPLEEGLKITVEEMKCVETSVYIPSNLFSSYVIKSTNEIVFKISHKVFIESIHIFGDDGNPSMKMSYKGPGSPLYLVLKHCEENIIVDCEIKTINVEDEFPEVNLADECNVNKVVLNAGKFVEVLSNIDHNSDEFELFLSPEPPYFKITTYGVLGDTQIIIPKNPDIVLIFNCPNCESTLANASQKVEHVSLEPTDPLIKYAITLHKYMNDMYDMITVAELAIQSNLIPPKDATSPIPEMPDTVKKHMKVFLNYMPKTYTPFTLGESVEVPELSKAVVRQLLSKCIATLFAHAGFETSHQSVLDILVDVVDAFFKKITFNFKLAEEDAKRDSCGFPHTIERVLTELGFGGMKGLHDYYQTRVVKYISVLQKRCKELNKHYETLLAHKSHPPVDKSDKPIRVNEEEDDDVIEVDSRQVHLPSLDGVIGFSSLETCFELLNSLEAETNLQNLGENEEDSSVTSPGVVSIPETELSSTLSPFAKKKRSK